LRARCPRCGTETFRLDAGEDAASLACTGCGRAVEPPWEPGQAELRAELRSLRDELNRLRQAVNFLNQRVR
jgi:hypothetical protein